MPSPDPHYFSQEIIDKVWQHSLAVEGNDSENWRQDEFGAWMRREDYGDRSSEFGWYLSPAWASDPPMGTAEIRARHWENYLDPAAAYTRYRITAEGLRNIRRLI